MAILVFKKKKFHTSFSVNDTGNESLPLIHTIRA